MNYNKMKTFQVVAESLSITNAAQKLRVSQPAVSQQLSQLEKELGMVLITRKRGKICLTPEGARLLPTFKRSFCDIEEAIFTEQAQLERMSGHVKIGSLMDHSTPYDLSQKLIAFSQRYPEVDIEVLYGSNSQIESWLRKGEIDLGLSIIFKEKSDLQANSICTETHVLACSRNKLTEMSKMTIEEILTKNKIIDFTRDFLCLSPYMQKNFPNQNSLLSRSVPAVIVSNFSEASKFVESGWGISILPQHIIREKKDKVCSALPNLKPLTVTLDLVHLKDKNLNRIERKLIDDFTRTY